MAYDWRAARPFTPVFHDLKDLHRILEQYREWYAQGCSDVEVSRRIRQRFGSFQSQGFKPKKKYDPMADVVRNKGR